VARLRRPKPIPGLYLWGGVGRGKSFMMDSFFAGVGIVRKQRWHFHRFMLHIHEQLAAHAGQVDPLPAIARSFAAECELLCLDEFHVRDITDAMLLRRLLESLQQNGVVLVTTSNCAPHQLYADGLQRSQFLPAIALIEQSMTVLNLDSGTDYRLRKLETQAVYLVGDDASTAAPMAALFADIACRDGDAAVDVPLPQGRSVRARRHVDGVVWFDFATLCGEAHGKADLVEIARNYHTVLLSGVPRLGPETADQARRFIWLIDEFYDRRVKLVLSAAAPADGLCIAGHVAQDFARSASRLTEMQTRKYLALAHLG
jgi:cell division protein ZapE